jgi:hypothetical protein
MTIRWVTGWTLDAAEREVLLARFPPAYPDIVAHHVTLRTGTDATTPLPLAEAGDIVGVSNDARGVQVLAVRIDGTTRRDDGGTYHITWSLDRAAGRRPADSNAVIADLGWCPLAEPIALRLNPARFTAGPGLAPRPIDDA